MDNKIEYIKDHLGIKDSQIAALLNITIETFNKLNGDDIRIHRLSFYISLAVDVWEIPNNLLLNVLNEPMDDDRSLLHYILDTEDRPSAKQLVKLLDSFDDVLG